MIKSQCTTCNNPLYIIEASEKFRPPSTKYWSYNEDGSKRPYCSCACGLVEYQNKNKNKNENNDLQKLQHPPLSYNTDNSS